MVREREAAQQIGQSSGFVSRKESYNKRNLEGVDHVHVWLLNGLSMGFLLDNKEKHIEMRSVKRSDGGGKSCIRQVQNKLNRKSERLGSEILAVSENMSFLVSLSS